ncbi:MAG TPA: zinc ribbon domain-containing protein [Candidatus Limnocylindrales bacterium]
MICANCGFQNAPTDEFCGSCGQFLAWTGAPGASGTPGAASGTPPTSQPGAPIPTQPGSAEAADSPTVVGQPPLAAGVAAPIAAAAPAWSANLQRCDVCGTANELSRTFCLNCGAQLKKAGTTTGAALAVAAAQEQRQNGVRLVAYAVGGALIFVLAAAAAFVALGGLGHGAPAASPGSPFASLIAANPGASVLQSLSPGASVPVTGTNQPVVTSPASAEPPPATAPATPKLSAPPVTAPPVSAPPDTSPPASAPPVTSPPATAPPAGGFVCAASTFSATQAGGWKVFHAHWSRRGSTDTLYLEMQPSSSGSTASVDANILPPDQVQSIYGVPGPSSGAVAVVLAFNDAVTVPYLFGSPVGYKALQEFQIYRNSGRVLVVMGVNGAGCYGLSSDAWTSGSTTSPELAVALQH